MAVNNNFLLRSKQKKADKLIEVGELAEAKEIYLQIYNVNKNDVRLAMTLATLCRSLGDFDQGLQVCEETVKKGHGIASVYHVEGSLLQSKGDLQNAIVAYSKAISRDSGMVETHYFMGLAYQECGDLLNAEGAFRKAVKINPHFLEALSNLGGVLLELRKTKEAREVLLEANSIFPNVEQVLCNLGELGLIEDKLDEALQYAKKAVNCNVMFIDGYRLLGKIYFQKGDYDRAIESYRLALKINPQEVSVLGSLAHIYERRRQYEEAMQLIEPVINAGNSSLEVLQVYASVSEQTSNGDVAIEKLEQELKIKKQNEASESLIRYQLGKLYDRKKQYERAFENYFLANEAEKILYERAEAVSFYPSVKMIAEWYEKYGVEYWEGVAKSECTSDKAIFIVGMPRSGTSLAEQILATHKGVYGAGELKAVSQLASEIGMSSQIVDYVDYLANVSSESLTYAGQKYHKMLEGISINAARVVDKMPTNFWYVGLITKILPSARVIHMKRNPMDVCLSMYFQRFGETMPFASDLIELGRYYVAYTEMMKYWEDVLQGNILNIQYEHLVGSQEDLSRQMLEFCGLDWDVGCLKFHESQRDVNTPSYEQVREPMYKKSVHRYKNYQNHLTDLEALFNEYGIEY